MVELSEILAEENIVLVDGSLRSEDEGRDFCREIYHTTDYSAIDIELIKQKSNTIRELTELLQKPNVWAIENVSEGMKHLLDHIDKKIKFLDYSRRERKHNEKERKMMYTLQEKIFDLVTLAKRKELKPNCQVNIGQIRYNSLLDMIKLIDSAMKLKKNTKYFYHHDVKAGKSDTPEKIAAWPYYLSLFSSKKPVLLTRNFNALILLRETPRIIGAEVFFPLNKDFREALEKNPFRLYAQRYGEYNLAVDSRNCQFSKDLDEKLKEEMKKLWQNFAIGISIKQEQSSAVPYK